MPGTTCGAGKTVRGVEPVEPRGGGRSRTSEQRRAPAPAAGRECVSDHPRSRETSKLPLWSTDLCLPTHSEALPPRLRPARGGVPPGPQRTWGKAPAPLLRPARAPPHQHSGPAAGPGRLSAALSSAGGSKKEFSALWKTHSGETRARPGPRRRGGRESNEAYFHLPVVLRQVALSHGGVALRDRGKLHAQKPPLLHLGLALRPLRLRAARPLHGLARGLPRSSRAPPQRLSANARICAGARRPGAPTSTTRPETRSSLGVLQTGLRRRRAGAGPGATARARSQRRWGRGRDVRARAAGSRAVSTRGARRRAPSGRRGRGCLCLSCPSPFADFGVPRDSTQASFLRCVQKPERSTMSRLTRNMLELIKSMARDPGFDRVLEKVPRWERRLLEKARGSGTLSLGPAGLPGSRLVAVMPAVPERPVC